jgi:pyruvate ferredoxin oxidoreductase delta subunit
MGKTGTNIKWQEITLGILIPDPGSSRRNLTGGWRSERPIWDHERCVTCGVCDMFCPEAAVKQGADGWYAANLDYCKGCGICRRECVTGAIKMIKEEV